MSSPVVDIGTFHGRDIIVQFGLGAAQVSFKTRIRRFIESYLGTPTAPIPFGGRDDELKDLNEWLADPDAPRNLLVTAPAGRGKTALLIRWVDQLGEEWPVCFVPISIRYETNRAAVFYQALAMRLASLLGETLPQTMTDPVNFYKEKATEYLEQFTGNRKCLLVVDGLDEAAGWKLDSAILPVEPPPGVRVLVSGRELAGDKGSEDWLWRLGWSGRAGAVRTIQVPRLTRDGVADVLVKMGFPLGHLAKNVDIVQELFRLTESGDPLLLEFYVKDLLKESDKAARLRPEDLKKMKPGFPAYFRDWFKQAWGDENRNEKVVDFIMLVLSCAAGPMKLAVLSPIVQSLLGDKTLITKQTMQPISRFVIGDGIDVGFAFAHPKLGYYVSEDYFGGSNSVQDAKKAICDWGRSIVTKLNAGETQPNAVPNYVLLYYLQHLEQLAPKPGMAPYRELIEDGWRQAWLAHEEGLRGFARDLQVVWSKLRRAAEADPSVLRQPRVGIGGLIRCALCLCSIRSVGSAVPPNFMVELVRQGMVTVRQALYFGRFKSESDQTRLLQALAPYLIGESFEEAIADARSLPTPGNQGITLAKLALLADATRKVDLFAEAIEVAQRIDGEYAQKNVIDEIKKLQEPPKEPAAEEKQQEISGFSGADLSENVPLPPPIGESQQEPAVNSSAGISEEMPFPPPDDVRAAFEEIAIEHVASPANFAFDPRLRELAPYLPEDLLERSLDIGFLEESWSIRWLLELLTPFLNERLLGHAFGLILNLGYDYHRLSEIRTLRPYLTNPPEDLLERSLDIWVREESWDRDSLLEMLAPFLNERLMGHAFGLILDIKSEYSRVFAFRILMPYITRLPEDLLERGVDIALEERPWGGVGLLELLGPFLSELVLGYAFDRMLGFEDEWRREYTFNALSAYLWKHLRNRTMEFALQERDSYTGTEYLKRLLPSMGEDDLVEALERIAKWKANFRRDEAFHALIEKLPDTMMERAYSIAVAMDGSDSGENLGSLLPYLQGELFAKALEVLPTLSDYPRTRMLERAGSKLSTAALRAVVTAVSSNLDDINVLIPYLSEEDRALTVANTYKTSFKIGDGVAIVASFMTLAERLPESEAQRACKAACQSAEQITEIEDRAFATLLLSFSRNLNSERRAAIYGETKAIASLMRNKESASAISFLRTLSPESSQAEFEEFLSEVLSGGNKEAKESIVLRFISLALNPRLSETDFRRSLAHVMALSEEAGAEEAWKDDGKSLLYIMLSALPRIPREEAEGYRKTGFELIGDTDKSSGYLIASFSPSLTAGEAGSYLSEALTYAKEDDESVIPAMLAPYMETSQLLPCTLKILDDVIFKSRGDLLLQLCFIEGQWLELIGVRPALGGGAGPKSTLERLGGPTAVVEAFEAMEDVLRWWP